MITEIGIVAGDIWHYLDERKSATFNELIKNIDKPRSVALMSLGWLAREGHVIVEPAGAQDDFKITLRF